MKKEPTQKNCEINSKLAEKGKTLVDTCVATCGTFHEALSTDLVDMANQESSAVILPSVLKKPQTADTTGPTGKPAEYHDLTGAPEEYHNIRNILNTSLIIITWQNNS